MLRKVASQLRCRPEGRHVEDLYIRDGVPLGDAVCVLAVVCVILVGIYGLKGRAASHAIIGKDGVAEGSGCMLAVTFAYPMPC